MCHTLTRPASGHSWAGTSATKKREAPWSWVGVNERVHNALQVTRVEQFFSFFPTVEAVA
jgi:hypothetical protein